MFTLRTSIHQYDTFAQFVNSFNLGCKDLVITQSFTYNQFIEGLRLPCNFIIQDKYGAGEPSDEMIQRIMDDNASCEFDCVIAIGGGTVIDISKLFSLGILENVTAAFERTIPIVKQKQLVIIPTTCGTGSEVTNISIAELKQKHTKLGLADDAILADDAVLIPELLRSLPFKPYAFSSIDALEDVDYLVNKIEKLRVFEDDNNKMNLSIKDINGEILLISQFTLYANTKEGNRPSFPIYYSRRSLV